MRKPSDEITPNSPTAGAQALSESEALDLLAQWSGCRSGDLPAEACEIIKECSGAHLAISLCGAMIRDGLLWSDVRAALRDAKPEAASGETPVGHLHDGARKAIKISVDALSQEQARRFAELSVFSPDKAVPEEAVVTLWSHTGRQMERHARQQLSMLERRGLIEAIPESPSHAFRLHDWVHDHARRIAGDQARLHDAMVRAYEKRCTAGWSSGPNDGYYFQHLRHHLIESGKRREADELLQDWRWLEAKVQAGLVFDLVGDFSDAVAGLAYDDPRQRMLRLLEEAIRRDVHFIARHARDYPQALFQCLWNSCWWYDCPDAAKHYVEPEGGWPSGEPPWSQPRPKLCELLERWWAERGKATPGFIWIRSLRPPAVHLGTSQWMVFREHDGGVCSVACSPDGRRIASGAHDDTVRIWDAESGEELLCLRGHEGSVMGVTFSLDGRRVASTSHDGTVRIWDAEGGRELRRLSEQEGYALGVTFATDGLRIVSGSGDNIIRIWDTGSGTKRQCLRAHRESVESVGFSPDGRQMVSGSGDRTIRIWDVESGAQLRWLLGHQYGIRSVSFSPDGRRVVSGSTDQTVRVWDTDSGTELLCMTEHDAGVDSVAYSRDGRRIVSGAGDRTVRIWDAESGAELRCLRGHEGGAQSVAFSPDGWRVVCGAGDHAVRVWDARQNARWNRLRGHKWDVNAISFSPDGGRVVTCSRDETVRIWDVESGAELRCLGGHDYSVRSADFSPDGSRIISRTFDYVIRIWDSESGAELRCVLECSEPAFSMAVSPDGRWIARGSNDNVVRIWDTESDSELQQLLGPPGGIAGVTFSPDGRRILGFCNDGTARAWNCETGAEILCLKARGGISSCTFSSEGRWIIGEFDGTTVLVWDAASGVELFRHDLQAGTLSDAVLSPDGKRIACSVSQDSEGDELRVWTFEDGQCAGTLEGVGDFTASATDLVTSPWRVVSRNHVTLVESQKTGKTVARFPELLDDLLRQPSGRIWAGSVYSYLCLFKVEGVDDSTGKCRAEP